MGSEGRALVAELFRFNLVGVGTLLIGALVFFGLLALDVAYTPALVGDYAAGILFSYYMHKTFTFRAQVRSDLKPLSYTVIGYIVSFLLNLALLAIAVELLAVNVVLAQVVIMLVLAVLNYAIFKFVVFSPPRSEPAAEPQASTEMLESEYHRMAELEGRLWWYRSLHADLLAMIERHFGTRRDIRILDAGCGTGGFLDYLRRHGFTNCSGFDVSPLAVDFCRQQDLDVRQGSIADAAALASTGKADLIVTMDVLYFLPDEQQRMDFFKAASHLLNDGGLLIVQTPAFRCLGGIHDMAVGVNRRYTKRDMRALLTLAGIDAYRLRYRLLLLTPLVFIARTLQRLRLKFSGNVTIESDVKMPPAIVNALLFHLQRFEDRWLPFRPFGTSLQVLVTKAPFE